MKWLFLVHQVYTPKSRERVKVWRSIKKIGAVLHRNSVYVLPFSKERLEDFQWVCQQIRDSKGEASLFVSEAQDTSEDRLLRKRFENARQEEYENTFQLLEKLRERAAKNRKRLTESQLRTLEREFKQVRESLEEIRKVDFFSVGPPKKLIDAIEETRKQLAAGPLLSETTLAVRSHNPKDFQNKVWTTREAIHIDRLGSAWLIRRFIDPSARFVFAPESQLPSGAIPFDVFGAEFSHRGENCTFETLMKSFGIQDRALSEIAEIIHDIDLKDHKFGRPEAPGVDAVIRSLADFTSDDHKFLKTASQLLDALYEFFSKKNMKTRKRS